MSKNLTVKLVKRTTNGSESWEGTVALPGVAPTKLLKAKTNESKFATRSGLTTAAQKLATRYGFSEVKFEGATENKKVAKTTKAKKKSVKAENKSETPVSAS